MENFSLKVNLLKLRNTVVAMVPGRRETKRCVIVPVDDNHLFVGEKGVYLDLSGIEMRERRFDDTHVLKQNLPREVYQGMSDEERREMPIVGTMRPMVTERREVEVSGTARVDAGEDWPF